MAQIKSRWKEHFDELYNVKITADKTVLCGLIVSLSAMRVTLWMPKLIHRDYYRRRWNGPLTT